MLTKCIPFAEQMKTLDDKKQCKNVYGKWFHFSILPETEI